MNLPEKIVEIAKTKLGEKEATGKNDGPFVQMLQRWVAAGETWLDGAPWCACFATWVVYQAAGELGITPRMPKSASSTTLFSWFKKNGRLVQDPYPGCIGLVKAKPGSGKTHSHTFIVQEYKRDRVRGIDGNYKNAVSRSHRRREDCDFGDPI